MPHALVSAATVAYVSFATWMMMCVAIRATRRIHRGNLATSVSLAVVGVALASYVTIVITFASPSVGRYAIGMGWLATAAYFVKTRAWRVPREATALFLLTAAIIFIHLGLLYLWQSDVGFWKLSEIRFVADHLPSDNTLPAQLAEKIGLGESTHPLAGDWNGSDRPPLQAGFILLLAGPAVVLREAATGAAAASVVAQALWVPATHAALRALRVPARISFMAITFAALTTTMVINAVFTWPKLLAAAMVLAAIALLLSVDIAATKTRWLFIAAVAAGTLGLLAHGGTAFAVPILVLIAWWRLRKHGIRALATNAAWGAVALAVLYVPWLLYQRLVDPPGDRLLKWHLAGVIPVTDESFSTVFARAYSSLSFGEVVANKWANVKEIFDPNLLRGLFPPGAASRASRNSAEFIFTSNALGLAVLILAAMLVHALVTRLRGQRLGDTDRRLALICAATLPSLAAWALIMFGPGTTVVHQGSHVWIILLLAVPLSWMALHVEWAGWAVVGLQGWMAFHFLSPPWDPAPVRPLGLATLLAGIVILAAAHVLVRLGEESPDRMDAHGAVP